MLYKIRLINERENSVDPLTKVEWYCELDIPTSAHAILGVEHANFSITNSKFGLKIIPHQLEISECVRVNSAFDYGFVSN